MVLEYESPVRIYKHPFELIMAAYEKRFPTCPLIPVFVGSEILSETVSPDGSRKTTERRCKIHVDAPYLLKKFAGTDNLYFLQSNELNLKARTLNIEVKNESFVNRITLTERCKYYVHPENANWTCYEQAASLEIRSFFGFESVIEKLAMKQYSRNVATGKEVIEHFINQLKKEGVTYIPPWQPKTQLTELANGVVPTSDDGRLSPTGTGSLAQSSCSSSSVLADSALSDLTSNVPEVNSATPVLCRQASASSATESTDMITPTCSGGLTLEADYIKRYLADLTPLQESKLVQFKKSFAHIHKEKLPKDTTLLRFLRARDFNVEKARELLAHSMLWRKKHNVDRILSDYQMPAVLRQYFPAGWHHYDKHSRPIYIFRLGQTDVKGLLKSVGETGLLKLAMHVCEEGLRLTENATRVSGHPVSTWSMLVDLDGLNMRHYWRPGIRTLLRIIEVAEANYPETLGRVFIVRAPRVFPILWAIVSTFIDERTREKFLLYAGNDCFQQENAENGNLCGGILDYIDGSLIPDFLGGPCKVNIGEGGLVPKSLYLPDTELEKEGFTSSQNSIYSSFTLSRGQIYEVLVTDAEPGAIITWDFDVMRHEVLFTLYRFKLHSNPSLIDKLRSRKGNETSGGSCNESKSILERNWTEGSEYTKVESVICPDGDSVQGSYIVEKEENEEETKLTSWFLLQWKHSAASTPSGGNQALPQSPDGGTTDARGGSSHKAQIMYFYELVHSSHYNAFGANVSVVHHRPFTQTMNHRNIGFESATNRKL